MDESRSRLSPVDVLESNFRRTAKGPAGECPLPEPGERLEGHRLREDFIVEHAGLMRIEPQPEGYNYDQAQNLAEEERFRRDLRGLVARGELSLQYARELLEDDSFE